MYKLVLSTLAFCALSVSAAVSKNTTDFVIATSPYYPDSKVHLYCFPVNQHFPETAALCNQLQTADSDFKGLPAANCTHSGEPIRFYIRGLLNGQEVNYEEKFEDYCAAKERLGLIAEGVLPSK